jgi:hypothetical protein
MYDSLRYLTLFLYPQVVHFKLECGVVISIGCRMFGAIIGVTILEIQKNTVIAIMRDDCIFYDLRLIVAYLQWPAVLQRRSLYILCNIV